MRLKDKEIELLFFSPKPTALSKLITYDTQADKLRNGMRDSSSTQSSRKLCFGPSSSANTGVPEISPILDITAAERKIPNTDQKVKRVGSWLFGYSRNAACEKFQREKRKNAEKPTI